MVCAAILDVWLPSGTGTLTTLATLLDTNGQNPHAGLIADAADNLYDTIESSGASSRGTVSKLSDTGPVLRSVGIVPEPASWALMINGFGLVGVAARRRRVAATT